MIGFYALERSSKDPSVGVILPNDYTLVMSRIALIPADARVEMDAKMAAGYFTPGVVPDAEELKKAKGRGLTE